MSFRMLQPALAPLFGLSLFIATGSSMACAQSSFLNQFRLASDRDASADFYDSSDASFLTPPTTRGRSSVDIPSDGIRQVPKPGRATLDSDFDSWDPLLDDESLHEPKVTDIQANSPSAFPDFVPYVAPDFDSCEDPLIRHRDTCYQGAQVAYGVIPQGSSELGIRTLELQGMFAVPLGSMDHIIIFTPFYRMDDLNAVSTLGVPDTLYEAGVRSFWKKVVNERLTAMAVFTPSVRSDFDSSEGAFKLFGSAMLSWTIVPEKVSMFGGVMYTGRQDFPVLPTMGVYWTPSPLWKFDIQFPSPRISRRLRKDHDYSETWAYMSGVFGGNTWAVKRAGGQDDQLTLRDLRLMLGIEHLMQENRGVFVETGWVFSRSMEFDNTPGQIDFGDAIILRAGIQF